MKKSMVKLRKHVSPSNFLRTKLKIAFTVYNNSHNPPDFELKKLVFSLIVQSALMCLDVIQCWANENRLSYKIEMVYASRGTRYQFCHITSASLTSTFNVKSWV